MRTIRIYFVDFWKGFDVHYNFFSRFLSEKYNVIIDNQNPDYVFFSYYCSDIYKWKYRNAIKIYYSGENDVPNFNITDYAIGFHFLNFGDRYLRFPLYLFYNNAWDRLETLEQKTISKKLCERKFCNFIYSNKKAADPIREKFFFELSKYKRVDSAGKLYNNVGFSVLDKLDFIKDYKFTISFENSKVDGYTTEKVVEPMFVNSIPIYYGNELISRDFNPNSMLIINNEDDFGQIIEQIEFLDQHDDAYLAKLQEHWLIRENEKDYWSGLLMNFFDNIFTQPKENAKRYPRFGYAKNLFKQEERCSYVKQNLLWNKFWGGIDRIRKMRYHE